MESDRLMKTDEAAAQLAISEAMIRKLARQGQLTRVKIGSAARWRASELDQIIKSAGTGGAR